MIGGGGLARRYCRDLDAAHGAGDEGRGWLTAEDQVMLWPAEAGPQEIGVLAVLEGKDDLFTVTVGSGQSVVPSLRAQAVVGGEASGAAMHAAVMGRGRPWGSRRDWGVV